MNRIISFRSIMLVAIAVCLIFSAAAEGLDVRIADVEEGRQLITSCLDYYEGINTKALEYFLQKKDGTIDEYISYSAEQVRTFSDEAGAYILQFYRSLEENLTQQGIRLPDCGTITVVATTGGEALGTGGYTHGTVIYLNEGLVDYLLQTGYTSFVNEILVHELFHCLTRSNPDFRADMYRIIGFTVNEAEFDIPKELADQVIANPDVERHDAYASFTIHGEKKDCYLLCMTDGSFEKPGDSFTTNIYTGVVTVEDNVLYRTEDVDDFWDVVGRNTDYVEDPEECMAVNFSYALTWGAEGLDGNGYASPEIISAIIDCLKR